MKKKIEFAAISILGLTSAIAISYVLALVGEPRNAWLFCDILNLCK